MTVTDILNMDMKK